MILEAHDNSPNSRVARVQHIDYFYQVEEYVKQILEEEMDYINLEDGPITKWKLFADDYTLIKEWDRNVPANLSR